MEKIITKVGHLVSYLCGLLLLIIVAQVIARYAFGRGFVILEELEWHLYAVGFLIGLPYCAANDLNIRIDLLYAGFSRSKKAWMEIFSILVLFMPFVIMMLMHSLDFVAHSWNLGERSEAPLGLPYRWVIKSVIPVAFLLLALAGISRLVTAMQTLRQEEDNGRK
jgi:TRAP-type mannitol/chloroaromatic compound transport system permease small subunit